MYALNPNQIIKGKVGIFDILKIIILFEKK